MRSLPVLQHEEYEASFVGLNVRCIVSCCEHPLSRKPSKSERFDRCRQLSHCIAQSHSIRKSGRQRPLLSKGDFPRQGTRVYRELYCLLFENRLGEAIEYAKRIFGATLHEKGRRRRLTNFGSQAQSESMSGWVGNSLNIGGGAMFILNRTSSKICLRILRH